MTSKFYIIKRDYLFSLAEILTGQSRFRYIMLHLKFRTYTLVPFTVLHIVIASSGPTLSAHTEYHDPCLSILTRPLNELLPDIILISVPKTSMYPFVIFIFSETARHKNMADRWTDERTDEWRINTFVRNFLCHYVYHLR